MVLNHLYEIVYKVKQAGITQCVIRILHVIEIQ